VKTIEVKVNAGGVILPGTLRLPVGTHGVVIFAHGSGSSRFSPRNRYVSEEINNAGIGTLLFDLLTPEEEKVDNITSEIRFNIPFLATRMIEVTKWLEQQDTCRDKNIGYFGASTGGGAALMAAAIYPSPKIKAIVSRGGRPDLAGPQALAKITVPTLLIVGGDDTVVIDLNKKALSQMTSCREKELKIVPGATHLFEEPGKLQEVAKLAKEFFRKHLA